MSPAKSAKTKPKSNTLTIDFSGICTLVLNQKADRAVVHLVDLGSAGFQRHYAALGLAVTEDTPRALKGPEADAAVSLPDANADMGLWNLLGTNVEIVGATGKLTVDDTKVDVTKKPGKKAESVRWLPDISFLAESSAVDLVCPTAATVEIPAGRITARLVGTPRRVEFKEHGTPVGPARYCLPRFRAVLPFEREIAIRLDRARVLRFSDPMSILISNTCVCALGPEGQPNHFYAHYDVVKAKRRPTVEPAGPKPMFPSWPEFCYSGVVRG